ncbi:Tfp pilus assembly protein PilX [Actinoalloteichus hoggarensis]|uniref:Uncharacterized protein n=1 Tax=Actinoalloteichus hoggarensis TaxID=1470176 RepID=A0A221WA84_9PSEU|nr:hypothetical protein [Actinoalloteichus hoggarensis]ASO22439.1 hypothetical protein AHOG_24165 [Actinoalloteichus hoggarensis]MBB5923137.1 Tfp pilus assembly protein PilX [Actinoalloteichus hoggarensis]
MTVMDVLGQLRRAHELLTQAWRAVEHAEAAIVEGDVLFRTTTAGSAASEVAGAARCASAALADLRCGTGAIGGA